ncbi:hypothetical protein D2T29_21750 [Sinirhodobacter populi]|uniref:Integrase n=1 Tax=Paenirhodobacter populi TaxID=2306993 RepID=A0A443JYS4_9RHOB|nr:hypothetical protein [Sinirhodobacter populi]RWR25703.1 hypothetical protein D2T29_21750 [Sinirhodobacter populi]
MAEAIAFRPRKTDQSQNLADYVAAARSLPFVSTSAIVWDAPNWNLTGLAMPERAGQTPTVIFEGGRSRDPDLTGEFGAFARAYVAFRVGEELGIARQIGKFTKPIIAMRSLLKVMQDLGHAELAMVGPNTLDAAMDHARAQGVSEYSLEQRAGTLGRVVAELNATGVLRSPFIWEGAQRPRRNQSRINDDGDRNFTHDEVEAVAEAFLKAVTPRQQIATSVLAILCSVPARISEVLQLPVDCDVILDPGDGYQAGLRWWPRKGGAPQVKYVPKAMIPVVEEALARLKRHTEPAREVARNILAGNAPKTALPQGWPLLPDAGKLTFDRALMITLRYTMSPRRSVAPEKIEPITYHQIMAALQGLPNTPSVFDEMAIRLRDGSPLTVNTHKPRPYLNTLAAKASVPQADIALWSGRKDIRQNSAYDHETSQELVARFRKAKGIEPLPAIPIDDQSDFDIAHIKETAHTTQFGWCLQSLRQNPCQMFGECLNCTHLVCIKGAAGKLENIRRELDRERQLRAKAQERIADGLRVTSRWIDLFDRKIARLEQLVIILESDDIVEGSPVIFARIAHLPQFDPIAPGKTISGASQPPLDDEEGVNA